MKHIKPNHNILTPQVSPERAIGCVLIALVLSCYGRVIYNGYIPLDDPNYLFLNEQIRQGLSLENIKWAFKSLTMSNWHPVTWISYFMDYEIYGMSPAGFHLTNLFLHAANTLLVFLFLRKATGKLWQSALVASIFGLHPIHVESVAWLSERKDVLSVFFGMISLSAYVDYSKNPSFGRYLLVSTSLILGLMSKPMLVTLPFLFLLLDYWPLQRFDKSNEKKTTFLHIILEKTPLIALSLLSSIITLIAQKAAMTSNLTENISIAYRVLNTGLSYITYLKKIFWPLDLAIFYPHPGMTLPAWKGIASILFLFLITLFVLKNYRKWPFAATGWIWFLGTLVPVIGIVQVGMQSMADRYVYLPAVGLYMAVVWSVSFFIKKYIKMKSISPLMISFLVILLSIATFKQLSHWKDGESVFRYALAVTEDNYLAHHALGKIEKNRGNFEKAAFHYNSALDLNPTFVALEHNKTGFKMAENGKFDQAVKEFSMALTINDHYANAHNNLAVVLARTGNFEKAAFHLKKAVQLDPGFKKAKMNLDNILKQKPDLK